MQAHSESMAAYPMGNAPVFFLDPPICCGKLIDFHSAGLVYREVETERGFFITVASPLCPLCGKLVKLEEDADESHPGGRA